MEVLYHLTIVQSLVVHQILDGYLTLVSIHFWYIADLHVDAKLNSNLLCTLGTEHFHIAV